MSRGISLDTRLLRLSPNDYYTLRDASQGAFCTGSPGSGKTSGVGAALAGAFLRAGMGGLICVAKPEEAANWRRLCAAHGRSRSLIEIDEARPGFNFIAYELARQGAAGLNSVVECLMRVLEIARAASPQPGRAGEAFWEDTTRQVLRNTIPVLFAATGTVRIGDLLQFVRSAPQAPGELSDPDWQRRSYFFECFANAAGRIDDATAERAISYWSDDYARLDPKTRGNIAISLTTALDRFNHGWLKDMFCGHTNFVPELTFHGAIVLLNLPALTLNEDGIIAQQLFKYMWQRAALARNALHPAQQERPIFLYADEYHHFANSYDAEFQSTCRGSRVCTVYLTQSLPTLFARMAGEHARERVHHLLGNFATKIWCSNSCAESNRWAAETLGQVVKRRASFTEGEGANTSYGMTMGEGSNRGSHSSSGGTSSSGGGSQGGTTYSSGSSWSGGTSNGDSDNWGRNRGGGSSWNTSHGYSEQMGYALEPGDFGRMLKTGGPANANRVSAVWCQAGRRFAASDGNAFIAEFAQ